MLREYAVALWKLLGFRYISKVPHRKQDLAILNRIPSRMPFKKPDIHLYSSGTI